MVKSLIDRSLEINSILLNPTNPFQWASGYYMPIYNDNRMHLADYTSRRLIAEEFAKKIKDKEIEFDIIGGIATAGIPHSTTLADLLEKPLIYIRDKPKDHGLRNQIEGIGADSDLEGKTVLLIEDLVSTGGSTLKAVQAVRNARGKVRNVFSIYNYGFAETKQSFRDAECELDSLITYELLMQRAIETGYINEAGKKELEEWRKDPFNWGEKRGFRKKQQVMFREIL